MEVRCAADVDECAVNDGGCSPDATCNNTIGSFVCVCPTPGYADNGFNCSGITLRQLNLHLHFYGAVGSSLTKFNIIPLDCDLSNSVQSNLFVTEKYKEKMNEQYNQVHEYKVSTGHNNANIANEYTKCQQGSKAGIALYQQEP